MRVWITWWIIFCIRYQVYFEYILKKYGEKTDNPSKRICVNKLENRITFKIKTGYYLKILTPETMQLLGENLPHLKITEVVLVHCNIVNNDYQQDLKFLYTFVPNKSFGQLLDIPPKNIKFLKTSDSEFSYIEVWFTDQNSKPL